jgi:hypothetical protein
MKTVAAVGGYRIDTVYRKPIWTMRKYLIALAATFAIVAALTLPNHRNSDGIEGTTGVPPGPSRLLGEHRNPEAQKLQITPMQAQASVVGLAFGR